MGSARAYQLLGGMCETDAAQRQARQRPRLSDTLRGSCGSGVQILSFWVTAGAYIKSCTVDSAVSEPIREIELADLNGDGRQELAVLETLNEGDQRSVSVWRWHGWGFNLVWRSPSACIRTCL